MVNARPHHGDHGGPSGNRPSARPDAARPGRLNLLLSSAPWERESWADRLPPLLEPIGVRALHARSGSEAKQVLEQQPIHIAVVDLALPLAGHTETTFDEGGSKLLQVLARLATPPPTLVIKRARTTQDDRRELAAALRAGAFAVLDRPRSTRDLELMLEALRRCLHRHYRNQWPST